MGREWMGSGWRVGGEWVGSGWRVGGMWVGSRCGVIHAICSDL